MIVMALSPWLCPVSVLQFAGWMAGDWEHLCNALKLIYLLMLFSYHSISSVCFSVLSMLFSSFCLNALAHFITKYTKKKMVWLDMIALNVWADFVSVTALVPSFWRVEANVFSQPERRPWMSSKITFQAWNTESLRVGLSSFLYFFITHQNIICQHDMQQCERKQNFMETWPLCSI